MSQRLLKSSNSFYQRLLRLYPPRFRAEFGPEMGEVFRYQCQDAYAEQRLRGVVGVWLVTLLLFPASVWQEYRLAWQEYRKFRRLAIHNEVDNSDFDALFLDFPRYVYEIFINILTYAMPGGPITTIFFLFIAGGIVGGILGSPTLGVLITLLAIPGILILFILGGLASAFIYTLIRVISRFLNNLFNPEGK
jgi:hypothetical protein